MQLSHGVADQFYEDFEEAFRWDQKTLTQVDEFSLTRSRTGNDDPARNVSDAFKGQ
jgi:hypothetical protein